MAAPLVSVVNLGCRVNRVESDHMIEGLARAGLSCVAEREADLVVINTCAVTGEAEAKTRKAVRRALAEPREPLVVVTGCAVNLHPGELEAFSPRVVEEPRKDRVPARALELLGLARAGEGGEGAEGAGAGVGDAAEGAASAASSAAGGEGSEEDAAASASGATASGQDLPQLLGRSRLGVKIQDGCNNRCSYCIVWRARGPERSEPAPAVVAEVREAARSGVPEVVLTGVNLAAYRWRPEGSNAPALELDGLLRMILEQTQVGQVRLSSLEPLDVTPALVDVMEGSGGRVAPFMHLPLQSGCTATLRRMRRPYTAEQYAQVVEAIRKKVPAIAIACDVIVGFPGETDEEFEESYSFCERMGFSRMHVFRYSARPGTPAAEAPDQVPPQVMAERSARLRTLGERMARADAARRIGTVERAVLEDGACGTLGSFHRVVVDGLPADPPAPVAGPVAQDSAARLIEVAIMSMDEDGLLHGRLASQA